MSRGRLAHHVGHARAAALGDDVVAHAQDSFLGRHDPEVLRLAERINAPSLERIFIGKGRIYPLVFQKIEGPRKGQKPSLRGRAVVGPTKVVAVPFAVLEQDCLFL